MDRGTIAAIATPMGRGGIGIIKISGTDAIGIASAIFRPSKAHRKDRPIEPSAFLKNHPHQILHGHIIVPETNRVLDEVLLSVMPGPKSYTREDVIEINTHSGSVVLTSVLDLIIKQGARTAEPGEFTKRAFLNGRIDLTQAEAVMDIINAKTKKALEMATHQVTGELRETIDAVLIRLKDAFAHIEAAIDFPEEVDEIYETKGALEKMLGLALSPLEKLLRQYETSRIIKDGVKVVIIGKPNVGKSSLMNCLVKKDRVIVSSVPGTTRDFIEEACLVENTPVTFTDTAGLHDTSDRVENVGIQKTHEYLKNADIVLFVVDISQPVDHMDDDIYEKIKDKEVILVKNKVDLTHGIDLDNPFEWHIQRQVKTSALLAEGVDELEKSLKRALFGEKGQEEASYRVALNMRHKKFD